MKEMSLGEIAQKVGNGMTAITVTSKAVEELVRQGKLSPGEADEPLKALRGLEKSETADTAINQDLDGESNEWATASQIWESAGKGVEIAEFLW